MWAAFSLSVRRIFANSLLSRVLKQASLRDKDCSVIWDVWITQAQDNDLEFCDGAWTKPWLLNLQ